MFNGQRFFGFKNKAHLLFLAWLKAYNRLSDVELDPILPLDVVNGGIKQGGDGVRVFHTHDTAVVGFINHQQCGFWHHACSIDCRWKGEKKSTDQRRNFHNSFHEY